MAMGVMSYGDSAATAPAVQLALLPVAATGQPCNRRYRYRFVQHHMYRTRRADDMPLHRFRLRRIFIVGTLRPGCHSWPPTGLYLTCAHMHALRPVFANSLAYQASRGTYHRPIGCKDTSNILAQWATRPSM